MKTPLVEAYAADDEADPIREPDRGWAVRMRVRMMQALGMPEREDYAPQKRRGRNAKRQGARVGARVRSAD